MFSPQSQRSSRSARRLSLEQLEARQVMDAGFGLQYGELIIEGTDEGDIITVEEHTVVTGFEDVDGELSPIEMQVLRASIKDELGNLRTDAYGNFLQQDFEKALVDVIEMYGRDGNDTLENFTDVGAIMHGGAGDDILRGGSGDDIVQGGVGNDLLIGGAGDDTYLIAQHGYHYGHHYGYHYYPVDLGTDTIDEQTDGGNDTIDFSQYRFGYGMPGGITLDLALTTAQQTMSTFSVQFLQAEVENATGTYGDDIIYGNDADNRISGGDDGNDLLDGRLGADTYVFEQEQTGNVTIDDGDGDNALDFRQLDKAVNIDLAITSGQVIDNLSLAVTLGSSRIRDVIGSQLADIIFGNDLDNRLEGLSGDDMLVGRLGDDNLIGGNHNDTLVGDEGDDTLEGGFGDDTLSGGVGSDTYVFAHNSSGGYYPHYHSGYGNGGYGYGHGGYHLPYAGHLGDDEIYESLANDPSDRDRLDFSGHLRAIDLDLTDTYMHSGYRAVSSRLNLKINDVETIEEVIGTTYGDEITGNSRDNLIEGRGGNDVLNGQAGNDTLLGGAGDDTLDGGEGDDTLNGGADNDTYKFNNRFWSVNGGGSGYYNYYHSELRDIGTDSIVEGANADVDTLDFSSHYGDGVYVWMGSTYTQTVSDYLRLNISDATSIENAQGTQMRDYIFGNLRDNDIDGLGGNDYLTGGDGNDTINGGDGIDTIYGGRGDDTLLGGGERDYLFGQDGADTLLGEGGGDYLNGGNHDDILEGGYDGEIDTLIGGAGRDQFYANYYSLSFSSSYYFGITLAERDNVTDLTSGEDVLRYRYV